MCVTPSENSIMGIAANVTAGTQIVKYHQLFTSCYQCYLHQENNNKQRNKEKQNKKKYIKTLSQITKHFYRSKQSVCESVNNNHKRTHKCSDDR